MQTLVVLELEFIYYALSHMNRGAIEVGKIVYHHIQVHVSMACY